MYYLSQGIVISGEVPENFPRKLMATRDPQIKTEKLSTKPEKTCQEIMGLWGVM
jgi:hypothetical protein